MAVEGSRDDANRTKLGLDFPALIAVGHEGLWQAILRFDFGNRLASFAEPYIRGFMLNLVRSAKKAGMTKVPRGTWVKPSDYDEVLANRDEDEAPGAIKARHIVSEVEAAMDEARHRDGRFLALWKTPPATPDKIVSEWKKCGSDTAAVESALASLKPHEKKIIEQYFTQEPRMWLHQIARYHNVSYYCTVQIVWRAVKKLREIVKRKRKQTNTETRRSNGNASYRTRSRATAAPSNPRPQATGDRDRQGSEANL